MDNDCSHEIKRHLILGGKAMTNLDSILKSRDSTLPTKVQTVKVIFFFTSHIWMDMRSHIWVDKEDWAPKNWCFRIVVLKKILKSPLDCKKIKPVNPEENQPWIFIGRTDVEALILWAPDGKSQLTGKDPDTGEGWRQEEKEVTEDEMDEWHYWLNGHDFEQTPGDSEGQGSQVCCSPWGCKEADRTEWLNNNNQPQIYIYFFTLSKATF